MAKHNTSPANSEIAPELCTTDGGRQPPSRLIRSSPEQPRFNLPLTAQFRLDMLQPDDSQYRLSKNHPPKMAGYVKPRVIR